MIYLHQVFLDDSFEEVPLLNIGDEITIKKEVTEEAEKSPPKPVKPKENFLTEAELEAIKQRKLAEKKAKEELRQQRK